MLILSRKEDEEIVVCVPPSDTPTLVTVMVAEIRSRHPGKVRLGIEAPAHVPVHRAEVWDAIQAEGRCHIVKEVART